MNEYGNIVIYKDKNGNDIPYLEALDNMGMFASASSEYPHVSSYDEYITLKKPINERLGLPEPNEDDYNKVNQGDMLRLDGVYAGMDSGEITLTNVTTGEAYPLVCSFTDRQKDILKAGSLLAYVARG